jgi:hypothetical protein
VLLCREFVAARLRPCRGRRDGDHGVMSPVI